MNRSLLRKHIKAFIGSARKNPEQHKRDIEERRSLAEYYQSFTRDRIASMTGEDLYEYISRLWAMRIWGNKQYVVDKIIVDNGLEHFKRHLIDLVWGDEEIDSRWNRFRTQVKGMGPAMMSEILCKTHPDEYLLWNRRAFVGFRYLEVEDLPRYDYQLTGKVYRQLCAVAKDISGELEKVGYEDNTLFAVDYLIWRELQVEENLSRIGGKKRGTGKKVPPTPGELEFVHDDIRDKLRDIGQWLGFEARIEQKVSEGARVDTVWEATIGNMGRVIYVFEVQTKGSIDSLILNLLKSLNNPAVQGVVAVSDREQLERIRKQANDVPALRDKLKYWDYEVASKIHESLEFVNASINELDLVPQGFY